MRSETRTGIRAVALVAVVAHLATIAAYVTVGRGGSGPLLDPLRPLVIGAIYGAPALLAAAGLRGRHPLLLTAGLAAGLLALVPFSLHSFVLGPLAIVYAVAYGCLATADHDRSAVVAVVGCPLLLFAAFLAVVLHDDPVCYEQLGTGEVIVDRDPDGFASGVDGGSGVDTATLDPESNVVHGGCTSDVVVWWEAAVSLALSGGATGVGLLAVPGRTPSGSRRRRRPSPAR